MEASALSSGDREVRAARNQAIFRAVNEKLRDLNEPFAEVTGTGTFMVACECSRLDCVHVIEIPEGVYREVRRSPRTFVVLPEHVESSIERATGGDEKYSVVEVYAGAALSVVEETFYEGTETSTVGE
jgi:hypothetical protein